MGKAVQVLETGTGSKDWARWDESLVELGREFSRLQYELKELERQAEVVSDGEWTLASEQAWLERVDPIRGRMLEIAVEIVDMPAPNISSLRIKAEVLLDLVDSDRADTAHQLAASLCRDILALDPAAAALGA